MEGGTLLAAGEPEPQCWWATIAALAENDFNLAAGRYKPQVADAAPEDDPAELIRETLEKERSILDRSRHVARRSGGAAVKWPQLDFERVCCPTTQRDPTRTPDAEFRYIDIASVDKDAKRIVAAQAIRGAQAPSRARKEVRAGDVLVSTVRPNLNAVALVPDDLDGEIASTGFCVLRANRKLAEPRWLFYRCLTPDFVAGLVGRMRGANYPAVSDGVVKSSPMPLPAPREQRRIVELLAQADALRRQRAEADSIAARILPALFRKMFGDPVANPKGWPVQPMSDFIEFLTSGSRGWAKHYRPNGDLFLRIQNVGRNELLLDDVTLVEAPADAESHRTRVRPRDLLLSITADLGRSAVIPESFPVAYINQHLALLRLRGISPIYVSALLSSHEMRQRWSMIGRDAVKLGLNFDDIRTFRFPVPTSTLQSEFEAVLAAVNVIRREQRNTRSEIRNAIPNHAPPRLHRRTNRPLARIAHEGTSRRDGAAITEPKHQRRNAMIQLSLKGLAKFMTASAAGQRKVLQQYKFPDDEGQVLAKYYRDARDTIARYHEQKHPESWLLDKASDLLFDAKNAPKPQIPIAAEEQRAGT